MPTSTERSQARGIVCRGPLTECSGSGSGSECHPILLHLVLADRSGRSVALLPLRQGSHLVPLLASLRRLARHRASIAGASGSGRLYSALRRPENLLCLAGRSRLAMAGQLHQRQPPAAPGAGPRRRGLGRHGPARIHGSRVPSGLAHAHTDGSGDHRRAQRKERSNRGATGRSTTRSRRRRSALLLVVGLLRGFHRAPTGRRDLTIRKVVADYPFEPVEPDSVQDVARTSFVAAFGLLLSKEIWLQHGEGCALSLPTRRQKNAVLPT
jgi:hypothetical protein